MTRHPSLAAVAAASECTVCVPFALKCADDNSWVSTVSEKG